MGFENYTNLMPSEEDVGKNLPWALRALLKPVGQLEKSDLHVHSEAPATSDLLVPFQYRDDRVPEEPKIELPDGMFREALSDIKDGQHVCFKVQVYGVRKCKCQGKRHRVYCILARSIAHAVETLRKDLEVRSRLQLCIAPIERGDSPIMMDDHDGIEPPTVRFRLVPREAVQQS